MEMEEHVAFLFLHFFGSSGFVGVILVYCNSALFVHGSDSNKNSDYIVIIVYDKS